MIAQYVYIVLEGTHDSDGELPTDWAITSVHPTLEEAFWYTRREPGMADVNWRMNTQGDQWEARSEGVRLIAQRWTKERADLTPRMALT